MTVCGTSYDAAVTHAFWSITLYCTAVTCQRSNTKTSHCIAPLLTLSMYPEEGLLYPVNKAEAIC